MGELVINLGLASLLFGALIFFNKFWG